MATRKQFETELARHQGATLDLDCVDFSFTVDAPSGRIWSDNRGHCLVEEHSNESGESFKRIAYDNLIERMRFGTEVCDTPECDACAERNL